MEIKHATRTTKAPDTVERKQMTTWKVESRLAVTQGPSRARQASMNSNGGAKHRHSTPHAHEGAPTLPEVHAAGVELSEMTGRRLRGGRAQQARMSVGHRAHKTHATRTESCRRLCQHRANGRTRPRRLTPLKAWAPSSNCVLFRKGATSSRSETHPPLASFATRESSLSADAPNIVPSAFCATSFVPSTCSSCFVHVSLNPTPFLDSGKVSLRRPTRSPRPLRKPIAQEVLQ